MLENGSQLIFRGRGSSEEAHGFPSDSSESSSDEAAMDLVPVKRSLLLRSRTGRSIRKKNRKKYEDYEEVLLTRRSI